MDRNTQMDISADFVTQNNLIADKVGEPLNVNDSQSQLVIKEAEQVNSSSVSSEQESNKGRQVNSMNI